MDYTAVGDVVNTASRIEGMTKETPYSVLIAESTIESLRNPPSDIVFYEEQSVAGRQEKLKLYALDIRSPTSNPRARRGAWQGREWTRPSRGSAPAPAVRASGTRARPAGGSPRPTGGRRRTSMPPSSARAGRILERLVERQHADPLVARDPVDQPFSRRIFGSASG